MHSKTFTIILSAVVGLARAAPQQNPYAYAPQPYASAPALNPPPQSLDDPNPPHYDFKYEVSDPVTGDQHQQEESRNDDKVEGSYSLVEPDGSVRVVTYHASDEEGFVAKVEKIPAGSAPPNPSRPSRSVSSPSTADRTGPVSPLNDWAYIALASSPSAEVAKATPARPVYQPRQYYQHASGIQSPQSQAAYQYYTRQALRSSPVSPQQTSRHSQPRPQAVSYQPEAIYQPSRKTGPAPAVIHQAAAPSSSASANSYAAVLPPTRRAHQTVYHLW